MKVLISGAAGFIGANLSEKLLAEGHQVWGIDNFYSASPENISDLNANENFTFIDHDINSPLPDDLNEITFDQIYHLACPASPPRYQKDHIYTLKTNFLGTLNLLEFAKNHNNSPSFLFTSTSEVYGDPLEHPQEEEYRGNVNPHGLRSCYDEGKRVAESLCMNYWRQHKISIKIVRIFNTYGPKMDPEDGRVVSNFIMQALRGKPLEIYGDGSQTRSFQYIDDLLNGMISFMELKEDFPGPINLGNPDEMTILEFAEQIKKHFPDLQLTYKDLPSDDPLKRKPNIALAKNKLNWEPRIALSDGLEKTIAFFKTQL